MSDRIPRMFIVAPPTKYRDRKRCFAFAWIGQSFKYCDDCGMPYWEHTHFRTSREGRWFHQVISAESKEAVKKKWNHGKWARQ